MKIVAVLNVTKSSEFGEKYVEIDCILEQKNQKERRVIYMPLKEWIFVKENKRISFL